MKNASLILAVSLLFAESVFAHGKENHGADQGEPKVLAPGYEILDYPAPEPGSYELPFLGPAADGQVLTTSATAVPLHSLMHGKVTVLSFIYQACDDVNGCPLATFILHQVRQQLETLAIDGIADLKSRVQLVSLSFDPENDTPESLAEYAGSFGDSDVGWEFLTVASTAELDTLLDAYGQSIKRGVTEDGRETINHMLRVYVIDANQQIRNIYNSALIHADTLLSDIQTLVLEAAAGTAVQANLRVSKDWQKKPDDRSGYASGDYTSQSLALNAGGQAADLLQHAQKQHLGLPQTDWAAELDASKIALGRRLFFDRRLSINKTISCAMCHAPQQGFANNELATAVGVEGRTVKRNAPGLLNVAFLDSLFHDGRESRLEQQIWLPLLAHNEMANPSVGYVLDTINAIPEYADSFRQLYGEAAPDMTSLGDALSAYQRTLIAANSPFDRWYFGNDEQAVSAEVKAGFDIFTGKGRCSLCHGLADDHALFTDQQLHNTGIGYARSMHRNDKPRPVTLAPGVVVMVDPAVYADAAEKPPNDLGRYEVTENPDDRWKFRTPMLRNLSLTAPYMHDGSLASIEAVIDFYDAGGVANPLLSPLLQPLALSELEKRQLAEFLRALTSDDVGLLVNDGLAAPVGDVALR